MKTIAIYARVSTEKQEKENTIQSQLFTLREFAQKNHYVIIEEYIDEGYSGELLSRPALDKLRDDALNKSFEAVLIHCPDRLSRNHIYQGLIKLELRKLNINLIFLNNPQLGNSPEDMLSEGMQGLIAEYEKTKILERTRRGKIYKAKMGQIMQSQAPYGYNYISKINNPKEGAKLEINFNEEGIVKLIFDLFVNKRFTVNGIATELTIKKIPTRTRKQGWAFNTIRNILMNRVYIGTLFYNKSQAIPPLRKYPKRYENNNYVRRSNTSQKRKPQTEWIGFELPEKLHIIDKFTFEKAQKRLNQIHEHRERQSHFFYILKGLIRCKECGSSFVGTSNSNRGKKRSFYRCSNKFRYGVIKGCKDSKMINAVKLENLVWDSVTKAVQQPQLMIEKLTNYHKDIVSNRGKIEGEIKGVEVSLLNLKESKDKLLDLYSEGTICKEDLKNQIDRNTQKEKALIENRQRLIEKLHKVITPVEIKQSILSYCENIKEKITELTDEEKRETLNMLVEKIIIDKNRSVVIKLIIPNRYEEKSNVVLSEKRQGTFNVIQHNYFEVELEEILV